MLRHTTAPAKRDCNGQVPDSTEDFLRTRGKTTQPCMHADSPCRRYLCLSHLPLHRIPTSNADVNQSLHFPTDLTQPAFHRVAWAKLVEYSSVKRVERLGIWANVRSDSRPDEAVHGPKQPGFFAISYSLSRILFNFQGTITNPRATILPRYKGMNSPCRLGPTLAPSGVPADLYATTDSPQPVAVVSCFLGPTRHMGRL